MNLPVKKRLITPLLPVPYILRGTGSFFALNCKRIKVCRKNYSLIILGKHEPKNVINLKGETLGHSFFAWDMGTKQGTSIRTVVFLRTLGYPFRRPTDEQLNYTHSINQEITVWQDKNSIRIENDLIIIKLSKY
jgi:hypothetical protein